MATSYTAYDQAADLGIHRVHSLVLGDARKEARIAARFAPQFKRPVFGRGDIRHEEQQYNWEARMELDRIARRNNLKTEDHDEHDGSTLTEKIASWGSLKVDNAIARPDGLGTGNIHRQGPNYRPIASFGAPRPLLPLRQIRNPPGSSTFAARKHTPAPTGSVAAAWQAAALGKQFHAFVLGGNRFPLRDSNCAESSSSSSAGTVRARSPIRTPARKSIVGSPRTKPASPPRQRPPPLVGSAAKEARYAEQMTSTWPTYTEQMPSSTEKSTTSTDQMAGATYADQMARIKSQIDSEHAPPKSGGVTSPRKSPVKVALPSSGGLDGSRSPHRIMGSERSRWSGKLATASDPYFQKAIHSPATSPVVGVQPTTPLDSPIQTIPLNPTIHEAPESTAPTDTAPNTPASITTSGAIDIEEYLDLLETEQDEQDELERYKLDPDRLQRDLEINERVNRSLAEAEEAALAREILSPRPDRKTVQFVSRPNSPTPEGEHNDEDLIPMIVHIWNDFRDFVTVRSITGFEEYISEPRDRKALKTAKAVASARFDDSGETAVEEEMAKEQKAESEKETSPKKSTTFEIAEVGIAQSESLPSFKEEVNSTEPTPITKETSSNPQTSSYSPTINVIPPTPLPTKTAITAEPTNVSPKEERPKVARKIYKVVNGRIVTMDTPRAPTTEAEPSVIPGWETSAPVPQSGSSSTLQSAIPQASKYRPRTGPPPLDILRDVEPASAENTWDMASTPRTEISGLRRNGPPHRGNTADEEFMQGLSDSKKVDEKIEEKNSTRKVVIVDTKSPEPLISPIKPSPMYVPLGPIPADLVDASPVNNASFLIPLTPTIAGLAPVQIGETSKTCETLTTTAAPKAVPPTPQSPPPVPSALRTGMPVPVPHPPTPRPDVKSAIKPVIAPKPTKLGNISVPATPKAKANISVVVGGLIDPFLQNLQPTAKKAAPVCRPKTPRASLDSTDSTPEKKKDLSIEIPGSSSLIGGESTSPTSLSSSWTFVESSKRVPAAPPPTPVNNWFDITPTPAVTPSTTPGVQQSKPLVESNPVEAKPTRQSPAASGKHILTIQVPVGDSIIPVKLQERDDPEKVAEQVARNHNLETHVEKLVAFFKVEHAKAKAKKEERAARREKMKSSVAEKK